MKMNKKDLIDWERLANDLLDRYCEVENPNEVISWLLAIGYTREELITLKFDEDAVDRIDADYRKKGAW
jgi:hypothetical protein